MFLPSWERFCLFLFLRLVLIQSLIKMKVNLTQILSLMVLFFCPDDFKFGLFGSWDVQTRTQWFQSIYCRTSELQERHQSCQNQNHHSRHHAQDPPMRRLLRQALLTCKATNTPRVTETARFSPIMLKLWKNCQSWQIVISWIKDLSTFSTFCHFPTIFIHRVVLDFM